MPRKIRQLFADLERAGLVNRGAHGSHRNDEHPNGQRVTISGQAGADAHHYQEKQVRKAIEGSKK
jgi:predicted RNA binding protein YcfA (HicA-like mRNA interferase family)